MPSPTAPSSAPASVRGVGRLTGLLTPRLVHYLSLVVALAWICLYARGQWFFFDEWDFLKLSATDFLTPHVGHLSTIPMLVTQGLVRTIGMGSYWPYLILVIVAHLALAHVLWRAMNRIAVQPWIATALALVFALYGAGSENILWAFQFGFVGAMLLGAVAVLLADRLTRGNFWRLLPAIAGLSILALLFAGTAIPLVAAVAVLAVRRVGLLRAVLTAAIPAAIYLTWYGYVKSNPVYFMPTEWQPTSAGQLFIDVPLYALRMIVGALQGLSPIPFTGVVLGAILLVYTVLTLRRQWRQAPLALAFVVSAIVFGLMTGFSRLNLSPEAAVSSRYIYFVIAMLIPLIGVALTSASVRRRVVLGAVLAVSAAVTVFGALGIRSDATFQSARELHTRAVISAAITLLDDPSLAIQDDAVVEPNFAPLLTVHTLRALVDSGALTAGDFDQQALSDARDNITAVP
jgi:hypothetical protein